MIYAPTKVIIGSNVSINCTVLEGEPPLSNFIITPQGRVVNGPVLNFNVTMEDAGDYTCVVNNSVATVKRIHSLIVDGVFYLCIINYNLCVITAVYIF